MQFRSVLFTALLLASALSPVAAQDQRPPVELRILAINDFHGNLEPPPGGIRISDPSRCDEEDFRCGRRRGADGDTGAPASQ